MTTVFPAWAYGRFTEIQSNLRRKKLHRTKQGLIFLGGSFSNRDNVRAPIQLRRESQPQHLKRWFFLKLVLVVATDKTKRNLKKNFMAPLYGWDSTASRLGPLQGVSLLFTTKFPESPGTYFINPRKMKG